MLVLEVAVRVAVWPQEKGFGGADPATWSILSAQVLATLTALRRPREAHCPTDGRPVAPLQRPVRLQRALRPRVPPLRRVVAVVPSLLLKAMWT